MKFNIEQSTVATEPDPILTVSLFITNSGTLAIRLGSQEINLIYKHGEVNEYAMERIKEALSMEVQ